MEKAAEKGTNLSDSNDALGFRAAASSSLGIYRLLEDLRGYRDGDTRAELFVRLNE